MTLQEKLELAARVMGWTVLTPPWPRVSVGWFYCGAGENHAMHYCDQTDRNRSLGQSFRPHTDDGDSRRLEIACLNWMRRQPASNPFSDPILVSFRELEIKRVNIGQKDDTTPGQYRAAVLDLAAAIGEAINAA